MFALLLAAAAVASTRPPSPVRPNPCNPAESCRYVGEFPIKDAKGQEHKALVNRWVPYLLNGRLTLFPGEVVSLTLSEAGPVVTAATVLTAEDRDPALEAVASDLQKRTGQAGSELFGAAPQAAPNPAFVAGTNSLRVGFLQAADGVMILKVSSGYDRLMNYRAAIVRTTGSPAATSVCSTPAAKVSIETWPPPIVAIELTDFQLQPEGAAPTCR